MDLSTRRLRLTCLTAADAPALFAYRSHPKVSRYQTFEPSDLGDAERFLSSILHAPFGDPGSRVQLGIRDTDSGELLGDLSVHFKSDEPCLAEIGVTVAPSHQRRGIAIEAAKALIGHLFQAADTRRVIASIDPRNKASAALLRRLGFRMEAHFRESLWFKSEWVDDMVFAMLKRDWA